MITTGTILNRPVLGMVRNRHAGTRLSINDTTTLIRLFRRTVIFFCQQKKLIVPRITASTKAKKVWMFNTSKKIQEAFKGI